MIITIDNINNQSVKKKVMNYDQSQGGPLITVDHSSAISTRLEIFVFSLII